MTILNIYFRKPLTARYHTRRQSRKASNKNVCNFWTNGQNFKFGNQHRLLWCASRENSWSVVSMSMSKELIIKLWYIYGYQPLWLTASRITQLLLPVLATPLVPDLVRLPPSSSDPGPWTWYLRAFSLESVEFLH